MIQGTSSAISGYVERAAAEEIWQGGEAVTGGAYAPSGKAESVPGGYRLSGRWSFVSGCTHCTWLLNSAEARARLRLASTYATGGCAQVVDQMYSLGGGTSIYRSSLLQRRFRDIHAATQHMMVGQPIYELVGRVLLGLETDTSQL